MFSVSLFAGNLNNNDTASIYHTTVKEKVLSPVIFVAKGTVVTNFDQIKGDGLKVSYAAPVKAEKNPVIASRQKPNSGKTKQIPPTQPKEREIEKIPKERVIPKDDGNSLLGGNKKQIIAISVNHQGNGQKYLDNGSHFYSYLFQLNLFSQKADYSLYTFLIPVRKFSLHTGIRPPPFFA